MENEINKKIISTLETLLVYIESIENRSFDYSSVICEEANKQMEELKSLIK